MFGIEFYELLIFFQRLGLAVVGATSLWGTFFLFMAKRASGAEQLQWRKIASSLLWIFLPPLFIFLASWLILALRVCAFCASAHEGISLAQKYESIGPAMQSQLSIYILLVFVALGGILLLFSKIKLRVQVRILEHFYALAFILVTIVLIFPWAGNNSFTHNLSIALHNWHSVLTLGTVLVVDFLFTMLNYSFTPILKKIFPFMTKAIWLGLGLDFLSAGLVFDEEFFASDKILFIQMLVGIIIINGALLSGPIIRSALEFKEKHKTNELSPKLYKVIGISGVTSLIGWMSITALDGFRSVTLNFWQLSFIYISMIVIAYISRGIIEKLRRTLMIRVNS